MTNSKRVPQMVTDFVLVKVEEEFQKGYEHGTLKLEMAAGWAEEGFNRAKYVAKSGEVVSIPKTLSACREVKPDIQVGDIVHFHYNSIDDDSRLVADDGEVYHRIMYDMINVAIRGEEIIPIAGVVLCEPIYDAYEEGEELVEMELNGNVEMVQRRVGSGIITKATATHNHKEAMVAHIGSPLKGDPKLGLKSGDKILYVKDADFDNVGDKILGKKYFFIHQSEIEAIVL